MRDRLSLVLRSTLTERVELDGLAADRLAVLGERDIAALPVWIGSRVAALGDLFAVRGERATRVHVEGDLSLVDNLGAGMSGGEMVVEGPLGHRVGAGMRGGWLDVRGAVGDDAGLAMHGGFLRIVGNAGDRVGAGTPGAAKGMTGGEIVVNGSVGNACGTRARRGLIVVAGDAGTDVARDIIAGTVVVFGAAGTHPGRGSKRGSVVALGPIAVPPTYRYACTYQPPYLRLLFTYLRRRYGLDPGDAALAGPYRRYCGDAGGVGKGEILELAGGERHP